MGSKIQHALRAFTAKDRKAIKLVVENFPETNFYKTDKLISELGIGEAFVTVLNEKGVPTPLIHTLMCAPKSRMDVLSKAEQKRIITNSEIAEEYNEKIDRKSAHEILQAKLEEAAEYEEEEPTSRGRRRSTKKTSVVKTIANSSAVRTILREITRGILGVLIGKPKRRSTRRRKRRY